MHGIRSFEQKALVGSSRRMEDLQQQVTLRNVARVDRVLKGALSVAIVATSVVPLLRCVGIALQRIGYPFDLEWMEGGAITEVRVAISGRSLFGPPSLEFTPFVYAPAYYYVSALASLFIGLRYSTLRLVSLVSILGCFVLLGRWVRDETDDPVAGVA